MASACLPFSTLASGSAASHRLSHSLSLLLSSLSLDSHLPNSHLHRLSPSWVVTLSANILSSRAELHLGWGRLLTCSITLFAWLYYVAFVQLLCFASLLGPFGCTLFCSLCFKPTFKLHLWMSESIIVSSMIVRLYSVLLGPFGCTMFAQPDSPITDHHPPTGHHQKGGGEKKPSFFACILFFGGWNCENWKAWLLFD